MAVVVLPDWSNPQEFHDNLTSRSNRDNEKEDIQVDLFSFCTLLQMNLSSAIMLSLDDKGNIDEMCNDCQLKTYSFCFSVHFYVDGIITFS